MRKLINFITPFIIGVVFLFGLDKFLDSKTDELLREKNLLPIMDDTLSDIKDKGVTANNHFLREKDIMILGSSELSNSTKQHPKYYFNTNRSKNKVFAIGRAYTQTLQDAAILGSMNPNIDNKKVVLLISMQWFMEKDGVTSHHYQSRFSPIQFYRFLDNPKISKQNKIEYAKKSSKLLWGSDEYKAEALYAKLYEPKTFPEKAEKVLLEPYFQGRKYCIALKEKGILYKRLIKLDKKRATKRKRPINWSYERKKAIEDAKKRVGKNPLNIDKYYYKEHFKDGIEQYKGRDKDVNLLTSKEFENYKLMLNVCTDLGIKPVVVLIPSMDKFYNLTGISEKERNQYYDKAQKIAESKGFEVLNLKDKGSDKYYLRDVMHLGTKGWVDVCERLFKIFKEQ
ncbi:D-alanyl-lipoteichoic acid biosynthesis protein DltD [Clostridioides difficile]|uniref:D-alanyl-lipoteichoic acid biosynthesis protein DltD n=1 Tax=Clostridioides difficile TaxID=1496 RepID=UPI000BB1AA6C|nr:D-alanyl-lipoteichoic acid biosynthesis protein DltD [Clostridioides difficile]PBI38832.1 D-alanyl-lipoteichoic acid biosynthesis protein DltD [Clostridioides difficile]